MEDLQPESAALHDARAIAARIADDEVAADDARRRYQTDGLPVVDPDVGFAPLALPGEVLHAIRESVLLERTLIAAPTPLPQAGTLYLSSERLLHVGAETTSAPLSEIDEMAVALERLLLVRLRDGIHLAIEVDGPRLLRVQVAAAMAATRVSEVAEPSTAATASPQASRPARLRG